MDDDAAPAAASGTDRIFAAVALAAAALTVAVGPRTPLLVLCVAVSLAPWAAVVAGRSVPVGVFALLTVAPVVPVVVADGAGSVLFLGIAAVSLVASRSGSRWLVGGTAVAVAAIAWLPYVVGDAERDPGARYFAFGTVFGALTGVLLRRATRLADELRRADARLVEAAARQERLRVARDVHDLVAHSLTVVVLHVAGSRRVLRTDPDRADAALRDAERVCRESLDGIRGVVGLLRDSDAGPRPLSLDLEDLAAGYRDAGLPVDLRVDGHPDSWPLVVRVTLHRVVQEALANAARYGDPSVPTTVVVLTAPDGEVRATVTNRRASSPSRAPRSSGGYGLVGLRERAGSLGGGLTSGPDGDDWVVHCRLPAESASAELQALA